MARYAALLRGVSPVNVTMPALKKAFEAAGFTNVRTILGSGNVVFDARKGDEPSLERRAEAAMKKHLDKAFLCIVRSVDDLSRLIAADPYGKFRIDREEKRVVTFLRARPK